MTLRQARPRLAGTAATMVLFTFAQALFVVLVFDWSVGRVALGGLAGAAIFGAFDWLFETCRAVPGATELIPTAPDGSAIDDGPDGRALWRWIVLPGAGFALAWVASAADVAAAIVPGQTAGYAASNLVGLVLVRRWERRDGRELLLTREDREAVLYAR